MAFIKRHLMLLLCGTVAFLSLVAMVLGIFLGDVSEPMAQAKSLEDKLASLSGGPVNERHIRAATERTQRVSGAYQEAQRIIRQINARTPILDSVFPTPKSNDAAFKFPDAYKAAAERLLKETLKSRPAPTEEQFAHMRMVLLARKTRDAAAALENRPAAPSAPSVPAPAAPPAAIAPGLPVATPAGPAGGATMVDEAEVRALASLAHAHTIKGCYADIDSLDLDRELLTPTRDPPHPEQMWDAQMGLWIQQDVAAALARVNEKAAAEMTAAGREADVWVAYLPVKDLIRIEVGDYVFGQPGAAGSVQEMRAGAQLAWFEVPSAVGAGQQVTLPVGDLSKSFTQRTSNELYDVIHFAVDVVVDARALPTVLDAISSANFYTLLAVATASPAVDPMFIGKVYGPNPVVEVLAVFEGCFFREIYHPLMPPDLSAQIKQGQRIGRDRSGFGGMPGMMPSPVQRMPGDMPRRGGVTEELPP